MNQKGIVWIPIIIWTIIISGTVLIAQDAVKSGFIKVNLSGDQETSSLSETGNTPEEIERFNAIVRESPPTPLPTPTPAPIKTPVPQAIPTPTPTKQPLPVLNGGNIFNMVNAFRTANGKPGLSVSDELCRLAEARADYMMANNMAAFKSSKTGGHTGLIDVSSQYSGSGVGENLAANLGTDASVIEIWKNSPPHRELMLWTEKNGSSMTKGCIATRVSEVGSIIVLFVGDK